MFRLGPRGDAARLPGVEDRSVLSQMAVSSGYLSVLVLALYIDEPVVQEKFGAPWMLWAVCPAADLLDQPDGDGGRARRDA